MTEPRRSLLLASHLGADSLALKTHTAGDDTEMAVPAARGSRARKPASAGTGDPEKLTLMTASPR